ncbi:MAG: metal-dependent hydrolase [Pirellulales bacterium]|nr:metal-dependent hydrolase [Pirellulales bacterium]
MANFRTHMTISTALGFGYAGAGLATGAPMESVILAGGFCTVSGMLPDIDSDKGVPLRETMAFLAAIVPMLMVDRMQQLGLSYESMVLAGGSIYLFIRFGVARLLSRYTVHRGMFHSIPAALVFTGLGFLVCGCENLSLRYYKAGAILIGYMSHLLLDEIYAIEIRYGRIRFKKSFGTAIKVWGDNLWGNFSVYAKLVLVAILISGEPAFMERYGIHESIAAARQHFQVTASGSGEDLGDGQDAPIDRSIYDATRRIWKDVWQ